LRSELPIYQKIKTLGNVLIRLFASAQCKVLKILDCVVLSSSIKVLFDLKFQNAILQ